MAKYTIFDFVKLDFNITQGYGERVQYYADLTRDQSSGISTLTNGHEGVDFGTPHGTEIFVPFQDGIVLRAGENVGGRDYGVALVIWDPVQKIAMWFCHLLDGTVQVGDHVTRGQLMGHTNNTGNSSGEHCHVNFCETDESGNRLNTGNGSLGFLNLEDKDLVEVLPFDYGQEAPVQPAVEAISVEKPIQTNSNHIDIGLTIPDGDKPEDYMGIKKSEFEGMRIKCDLYDPMALAGYPSLQTIDERVKQLQQGSEDQKGIDQKNYDDLFKENQGLKEDIKNLNIQLKSTLSNYEAKCEKEVEAVDSGVKYAMLYDNLKKEYETIASAHGVKPKLNDILKKIIEWRDAVKKARDSQPVPPVPQYSPQPVNTAKSHSVSVSRQMVGAVGVMAGIGTILMTFVHTFFK